MLSFDPKTWSAVNLETQLAMYSDNRGTNTYKLQEYPQDFTKSMILGPMYNLTVLKNNRKL